jgi:hypothetical protein
MFNYTPPPLPNVISQVMPMFVFIFIQISVNYRLSFAVQTLSKQIPRVLSCWYK